MNPSHEYHLVHPSPWPAFGALAGFVLASGLVIFLHNDIFGSGLAVFFESLGVLLFVPGAILVAATMVFWWRDVVLEAQGGDHTAIVQLGLRYGMVLFILSEVLFFAAFFWAFFDAALFPAGTESRVETLGGVWPPAQIEVFSPFGLPFVNTVILLLSGVTVTWAHHSLLEEDRRNFVLALGVTVGLGTLFLLFQAYEYSHAAFGLSDTIYASTFYLATGFHGFHVFIGTVFLLVCFFRARAGHFSPTHHFGFEAAAWYWHFVDVVWLFLFCCVYWWGGG